MNSQYSNEIPEPDARVAEIMMALATERPGNPMVSQSKRSLDEDFAKRKIPTTVEEFMEMEGLTEWPEPITSEYPIEHGPKSVFGNLDEIQNYLKTSAPLEDQMSSLDALEKRINQLDGSLSKFSKAVLTDETRFSRIKKGIFYSNIDQLFMTEVAVSGHPNNLALESTEGGRQVVPAGRSQEKKKKDVNSTDFPGHRPSELPELPGQLEAPQLLHRVTTAQDFNAGFEKFWKKVFLSEASIAVVHDLFWWSFMKIFKPNTQIEQDRLFDRLADSFAALFFSIHPDTRDKILKVYPGILAQTIYMIFHDAFPDSHKMFGPLFKEEVVRYCWELTTGTRPPPGSWREWDIDSLQGRSQENSEGKQLAITASNIDAPLDAPKFDFESLYRTLDNLETEVVDGEMIQVQQRAPVEKPKVQEKKPPTSSFAGPGAQFEKVVFNLTGLSPLIAQFLNMKHLRDVGATGRRVRRTEIVGQPSAGKTFQDIIDEKKSLTKSNKAQYKKLCKETAEEMSRIERKRAMVTREINKIKANTAAFKQSGLDVKYVTDQLMARADVETRRGAGQVVVNTGEMILDKESESGLSDYEREAEFEQIYGMNEDGNSSAPGKSIKEQTRLHTEESDLNNNFKQTKKHMTRFTDDSD